MILVGPRVFDMCGSDAEPCKFAGDVGQDANGGFEGIDY